MECITYYPWEDRRDVFLTGYVLGASEQIQVGVRKPAVVICPGGAYLRISDQEAEAVALRFAAYGYHAFVLTYSVGEACAMPAPLLELAKSILYVRAHADAWLIDPRRVAVCGFSAGGHLCATLSTQFPLAAQLLDADPELVRPDAAILGYPVTDLTLPLPPLPLSALSGPVLDPAHPEEAVLPPFRGCVVREDGQWLIRLDRGMLRPLLGCDTPTEAQLREYSPVFHVTAQTPPTYLWATCTDEMVPPENSLRYAAALLGCGVPAELHLFARGPHGLSLADRTCAGGPDYINPACQQWVPMALTWLDQILAAGEGGACPEEFQ